MTTNDIIDGILDREKEGTPPYLAPNDAGGRTTWGISEKAHPELWKNGHIPSKDEARLVYYRQYVAPMNWIDDMPLRVALVDDGVLSGVDAAIKRFQWVLGVPLDGVIGPVTLAAVKKFESRDLLKKYVVERAVRITRLVERRPSDLTNLTGWIVRILSFLP